MGWNYKRFLLTSRSNLIYAIGGKVGFDLQKYKCLRLIRFTNTIGCAQVIKLNAWLNMKKYYKSQIELEARTSMTGNTLCNYFLYFRSK